MTKKLEIDKGLLFNLYIEKGLSTYEIAEKLNCWNTTIGQRLKEYEIPMRNPKKPLKPNRKLLSKLYIGKKLSPYKIADKFSCTSNTIRRWLMVYGITIRKKKLIKVSKGKLKYLYFDKRLSLSQIGNQLNCTPPGLLKIFRKFDLPLRSISESSKYYTSRHNFVGDDAIKAYIIGFRLGDLHIRRSNDLIEVGGGTTKRDQLMLFNDLFKNYGKVYIGNKDTRGAWHPEVYLNKSFKFLLPKYKKIPSWICESKTLFINFLAGYTDAEGNIGCYPRARLKIASYDYAILRGIARCLKNYFNIPCVFFLEKTDKASHNKDALSLTINTKVHLLKVFNLLKPCLKHGKRRHDLDMAIQNIKLRNSKL